MSASLDPAPERTTASPLSATLAWGALLSCALFSVVAYAYAAIGSVGYDYPLEWMEGGTLEVVDRVHRGLAIYCAPSLEYVPYIYTPLYYVTAAAVSPAGEWSFVPARLLSLAATVALAISLGWGLRTRGCSWRGVAIGIGFFFATYELSGRWFHLARVDTMFLFLLLLGLLVYQKTRGWPGLVFSATLVTLSFLTKQSTLLALVVFVPLALLDDRRRVLAWAGLLAIGIGGSCFALQLSSDGWFWTYVFDLPRGHSLSPKRARRFFTRDLLPSLSVLTALSVFAIGHQIRTHRTHALRARDGARMRFDELALFAALITVAFASRVHVGGYVNVLMPMHVALILLACPHAEKLAHRARPWLRRALVLALLTQFALLFYDPRARLPSRQDHDAGLRFLERVADLPDPVLVPCHRGLQARVGKTNYGYGMAGFDLLRSSHRDDIREEFERKLLRRFEDREFGAIILPAQPWAFPDISRHYERVDHLFDGDDYMPMTGARIRPEELWLPRTDGERRDR